MGVKRLAIRYWWFIVLLIVSGYFLASNYYSGVKAEKETDFAIANLENISKISISKNGASVTISLSDDGWLVNNEFLANNKSVESLFRVVSRLRASSPIPRAFNDSLVAKARSHGTYVQIFSNRRNAKKYHINSTETMSLGAIGVLNGATTGHKIELPNFDGSIEDLFRVDLAYWQSNSLSVPRLSEVFAVQVDIPKDPENSFRLDMRKEGISLYSPFLGLPAKEFDRDRVNRFLEGISSMAFNDVLPTLPPEERAKILYQEPDFIFTYYLGKKEQYEVRIIPIPVEEYLDELGRTVNYDLDRMYLTQSNDKTIYIINYIEYHPILRNISHFNPIFR